MKKNLSTLMQSLILFLFAFLIIYFDKGGKLIYFVYPFYNKFIIASAYILIFLAIFNLFTSHTCHAHSNKSDKWKILIILVPILFGFLITPRPLSDQTALARGLSSELSVISGSAPSFGIKPEDREIFDWIQLFNFNPEPDNYTGLPVNVSGFIVHEDDMPANTFIVARFTLNCCAADARPLGLLVTYDPEKFTIPEDWIEVTGQMIEMNINGERRSVIQLENIKSITSPEDPYVY